MTERGARGRTNRLVLGVGQLTAFVRHQLALGSGRLDRVDDVLAAIEQMATTAYDAVVVDADAAGGGRRFVTSIKEPRNLIQADETLLIRARSNHPLTPFFVFDTASGRGGWEVVVMPPELVYKEHETGMPLVEAVLHFDLAAWVKGRALLA